MAAEAPTANKPSAAAAAVWSVRKQRTQVARRRKVIPQEVKNRAAKVIYRWWRGAYLRNHLRQIVEKARIIAVEEENRRKERVRIAKRVLTGFFWRCASAFRCSCNEKLRVRQALATGLVQRCLLACESVRVFKAKLHARWTLAAVRIVVRWRKSRMFARVRWRKADEEMLALVGRHEDTERRDLVRKEANEFYQYYVAYSHAEGFGIGSQEKLAETLEIIRQSEEELQEALEEEALWGAPSSSSVASIRFQQRQLVESQPKPSPAHPASRVLLVAQRSSKSNHRDGSVVAGSGTTFGEPLCEIPSLSTYVSPLLLRQQWLRSQRVHNAKASRSRPRGSVAIAFDPNAAPDESVVNYFHPPASQRQAAAAAAVQLPWTIARDDTEPPPEYKYGASRQFIGSQWYHFFHNLDVKQQRGVSRGSSVLASLRKDEGKTAYQRSSRSIGAAGSSTVVPRRDTTGIVYEVERMLIQESYRRQRLAERSFRLLAAILSLESENRELARTAQYREQKSRKPDECEEEQS